MILFLQLGLPAPAWSDNPAPDLTPIAQSIAQFDNHSGAQLQKMYEAYYRDASPQWQFHWHYLRCEAAALRSNEPDITRAADRMKGLADPERYPHQIGYLSLCQAHLVGEDADRSKRLFHLANAVEVGLEQDDPQLLVLSYTRQANLLADNKQYAQSMESLAAALHQQERPAKPSLFQLDPAMLHFSLGRTFYYLNNPSRTDEALTQAINLVKPGTPLAWFIQFNYARILSQQGRYEESQEHLDALEEPKPNFGQEDEGFFLLFQASIAMGLEQYDNALTLANRAADYFLLAEIKPEYSEARMIRGQALLKLDREAEGWEALNEARKAMVAQDNIRGLAILTQWTANYHQQRKEYQQALMALDHFVELQRQLNQVLQQQALIDQQQALGQQMDRHRQRLANTSEAHYQSQQSLMMWQGLCAALCFVIFTLAVRGMMPSKDTPDPFPVRGSAEEQLSYLLQESKATGDTMGCILVMVDPGQMGNELQDLLHRDLRREDRCLELASDRFLLMLPWISDGELAWRFDTLPARLQTLGLTPQRLGRARVNNFDDVDSLLQRLEYHQLGPGGRTTAGGRLAS